MSTLAWELAGDLAPADGSEGKPGFWSRFIAGRQAQANRTVCARLAVMGDERLANLGFGEDDIRALRAGELRLPQITQKG